jgi:hypothetical protein
MRLYDADGRVWCSACFLGESLWSCKRIEKFLKISWGTIWGTIVVVFHRSGSKQRASLVSFTATETRYVAIVSRAIVLYHRRW